MNKIVGSIFLQQKKAERLHLSYQEDNQGNIDERQQDEQQFLKEKNDRRFGIKPNDPMVIAGNYQIFVKN